MPSEKTPRQNFFQLLPVLLWQIYLGLFYRAMGWILPKSWHQLREPVSSNPVIGGLQRRSQGWFHRGKTRHQRWWQKNIRYSALERWVKRQRYRLLGLGSAIFFIFLNFIVFISPARALVNVVPAFSPTSIDPGGVSTAIVQIFNSDTFQLDNTALTVDLPAGMTIADPVNENTSCGGTVTATAGGTSFNLSGGTVPPRVGGTDGTCTFRVDVTTTTQGTSNLLIPANSLTTTTTSPPDGDPITNQAAGSVGLTVNPVDDPSLSKSFAPTTIFVNNGTPGAVDESILTVTIVNNSTVDLTEVNLVDNLPSGLSTNGTATKNDITCQGGTITTATDSVTLSDVTIPAGDICTFSVPVVSSTAGSFDNVLPANSISTRQGVSNADEATAELNVQDSITAPTISKEFRNDPIGIGDPARLRINITNESDVVDLQGVELIDIFTDPNIIIADTPNASKETNGDCDGGGFVDDASGTPGNPTAGDNFFGIQGVMIPAGRTCRIEVDVTATDGGVLPNTIPVGTLSADQVGVTNSNEASDNLRAAEILVGKTYANNNTANLNVPTTLTITLDNTIDVPMTNVQFTDIFTDTSPPLEIAATPNASTTCLPGGAVTAVAGEDRFSLSGGTIAPNSSCTVTVDVIATGTATGVNRNDIDPNDVTADGGISNRFGTQRDLDVTDAPLLSIELVKEFRDDPVNINQASRLRLRIRPNSDVTDLSLTDTLPTGLVIANPPNAGFLGSNCLDNTGDPRTITAIAGTNTVTVSGIEILNGRRCNAQVNVVSDTNGSYLNEIPAGSITTDEGSTNTSPASDTLNVIGIAVEKDFTPETIAPGGRSRLRVTFTNDQTFSLTNVNLTDNFPAGATAIAVANPPNASTTCGAGVATATTGGTSVSLSGGTIPAAAGGISGTCTLEVDVTSSESSGSYDNTIPAGAMTTDEGISNLEEATATLNFSPLNLNVSKSFNPLSVTAGTSSRLTVELFNPSPSEDYLDVSFVDNMPTGMQVFAPPNASTTCTDGVISANSGNASFSFSGATLPANSSCTVSLDVTSTVNQTLINTIPAGGAITFQGATNTTEATASLANSPGVGVAKEFSPRIVEPGGTSRLTITIINGNDTNELTNLRLSDEMPVGVELAPSPNITTDCDGTVGTLATVTPNTAANPDRLELTDGRLGTESSCQFAADVVVSAPGTYPNLIPAGAILTDELASNPQAASDVLVAAIRPTITKTFAPDVINPANTSTLTLTLGNTNIDPISLTSSLTDTLPTNVTIASNPNIGGTCPGTVTAAAGSSTITYANGATIPNGGCTITVDVTSTVPGSYTNTVPADGLQTTAGTNPDPATDDLLVRTPPSITKSFNPTSIAPNGTSLLTITLGNVNTDVQTLTSPLVDTLPDDVVIANPNNLGGTCTTANVTAVAGANTVTYASGSTIPNGGCTITLNVTAPTEGTKVNVIPAGDLVTNVGSNNSPTTANLVVTTVTATNPDVILVKRITAINGTPTATIDPTSTPEPEDNDAEWPSNFLEGDVSASVVPSDVVDYTIYFLNTGDGVAENLTVCDILEPELTFIPDAYNAFSADADTGVGSGTDLGIRLDDGASTKYLSALSVDSDRGRFIEPATNLTSECDPNGSTTIDYSNAENTVVVDVTGSDTGQNPDIAAGTAGFVRFRVTVD